MYVTSFTMYSLFESLSLGIFFFIFVNIFFVFIYIIGGPSCASHVCMSVFVCWFVIYEWILFRLPPTNTKNTKIPKFSFSCDRIECKWNSVNGFSFVSCFSIFSFVFRSAKKIFLFGQLGFFLLIFDLSVYLLNSILQ